MQARTQELEEEIERRQQSYMRREDGYQSELSKLQAEIARLTKIESDEAIQNVPTMPYASQAVNLV